MKKRKFPTYFKEEVINEKAKKAKKALQWAKEFSNKHWFAPKNLTKDGFFTSYGPRHGILFVGDDNDEIIKENNNDEIEKTVILDKLGSLFEEGINPGNCRLSASEFIPYFTNNATDKEAYLILGDSSKIQSLLLTGRYPFIYIIDASREKNLTSFPASPCNTNNPKFFTGAPFDSGTNCKFFFIVPSSLKPQHIIGVFAIGALAHLLKISEETLIVNPNYEGNLREVKNKLKINVVKEFKDCQVTTHSTFLP